MRTWRGGRRRNVEEILVDVPSLMNNMRGIETREIEITLLMMILKSS